MLFSKKNFLKLDKFTRKLPLSDLLHDSSGVAWDKAENDLLNYNKTILTISSTSLVLSFSVIKITGIHINITLLGISWLLLSIALLTGAFLLFLKFIASLADGILIAHDGKVTKEGKVFEWNTIYFTCLTWIFYLSLLQLITFIAGLLLLIGTVFFSLTYSCN